MSEEEKNDKPTELETVKAEKARLEGELAKAQLKIETMERAQPTSTYKAEIDRLKEENKELMAWKGEKEAKELADKVYTVVDMKIRAGYTDERDRAVEVEKHKALPIAALDALRETLEPILIQMDSGGPKFKYRASKQTDNLENAVRARMGFAPKKTEDA